MICQWAIQQPPRKKPFSLLLLGCDSTSSDCSSLPWLCRHLGGSIRAIAGLLAGVGASAVLITGFGAAAGLLVGFDAAVFLRAARLS